MDHKRLDRGGFLNDFCLFNCWLFIKQVQTANNLAVWLHGKMTERFKQKHVFAGCYMGRLFNLRSTFLRWVVQQRCRLVEVDGSLGGHDFEDLLRTILSLGIISLGGLQWSHWDLETSINQNDLCFFLFDLEWYDAGTGLWDLWEV